jgi:hypothetical protein
MPISALLLLAASLAQDHVDLSRAEERRGAVSVRCHIPAERLVAEPGQDGTYTLLGIMGHAALSDAQLSCYAQMLGVADRVWPSLEDGRLSERYERLRERYSARIARDRLRSARADLRRRGLLAAVPRFDRRRETLEAFAVRLEALCGATPHSVLIVREGWLLLGDEVYDESHDNELFEREDCAREAATAAGFDPWTVHVSIPSQLSFVTP